MLVLSRRRNQRIVIRGGIIIEVAAIMGDKVRLGIIAPKDVPVHRQEVWDAIYGKQANGLVTEMVMLVEKTNVCIRRLKRPPVYVEAHVAHRMRNDGMKEWHEPEGVRTAWANHRPNNGVLDAIRQVAPEVEAKLAEIDAERAVLSKRIGELFHLENALVAQAFESGRPLTLDEVKAAKAAKSGER